MTSAAKTNTIIAFIFDSRSKSLTALRKYLYTKYTVKELCKEIEYSGDNMDRIYDDSYLSDIFSDTSMLALLEWTL